MTEATTSQAFKLVYDTGKTIESEQFLFACRGNFNSVITDNILFMTEGNLQNLDSPKVSKKVYYLMVEGLQNITRHQYFTNSGSQYDGGLFIINRKNAAYSITYGNWVSPEVKDLLEEKLDTISSKVPDELKEYYLSILNNSAFSEKGGAGLGLIDMARKSSGNLSFHFTPVDGGYFYYLNLNIAVDKNAFHESLGKEYLDDAIDLHAKMVEANAQILFKGLLNEENVNHLSNHIDSSLMEDPENAGLGIVMTELLRNVAKHAYNRFNQAGKPGVFMLQKTDTGYAMLSGNFVHEGKKETLHQIVNAINQLTTEDINRYLEDRISIDSTKGYGLMKLRKISGHRFEHVIFEDETLPPYFILLIQLTR
ncbi:MAG: hypothetical protein Kow0075_07450 [Salibacteraceae bacterium]